MTAPQTIRDLIDAFPRREDLVEDRISFGHQKITLAAVHKWAANGSIRAPYQFDVLRAANARGIEFSAEQMVRLHAPAEITASLPTAAPLGPREDAA